MNATSNYSCIGSTYSTGDMEHTENQLIARARRAVLAGHCTSKRVVAALDSLEEYWEEETGDGSVGSVERMREAELAVCETYFQSLVRKALGQYALGPDNPTGGCGYYDADKSNPFRVLFSDQAGCESYSNMQSAIDAAMAWAECQSADEGR